MSANPSAPAVNSGAHGDGARFDRRLGAQRTCPAPGRAGPHTPGWAITDPRLCAAIVDRLTFGGNIIETGTDSYRLAHTKAALAAMTTNQAAQAETLTRRGKR